MMAKQSENSGLANKPLIVIVSFMASLIALIAFLTGWESVPEILGTDSRAIQTIQIQPQSTPEDSAPNLPTPDLSSPLETLPAPPLDYGCPFVPGIGYLPFQNVWYQSLNGYAIGYDLSPAFWVWNPYSGQVIPYSALESLGARNSWVRLVGSPSSVCIDTVGQVFAANTP
ncbi:MAG: hypothetical protein KDI79_21125 [Anaerolineae bacterium]|nr:hypothetical protein [Anaerolineae bacterium]